MTKYPPIICPDCGTTMQHLRSDRLAQGKSNKYFCPKCDTQVRVIRIPGA